MKNASDFRALAREALKGKWTIALLVGVVASILGGVGSSSSNVNWNVDVSGLKPMLTLGIGDYTIFSSTTGLNPSIKAFLAGGAIVIGLIALVFAVFYYVLGSFVGVGYAKFNLEVMDHKEASFEPLFSYAADWKRTAVAKFLKGLYTLLWGLLLVIPGIIASYSYAMTEYILAEHPELTASEAIARSKDMMKGNRFRLFCLEFSFIGWTLLSALTLGIGHLWLTPYTQAAKAAFYREVSGTEYRYRDDIYEDTVYEGEVI